MSTMWRSRWAAIGAAVAVSLGAGGLGLVHATTSTGEKPIYKPINPCRLADTRPAPFTVGSRTSPLGPAESYTVAGWGAVGTCNLPNDTAGLALNVTAISPSQATFLTLYPTGGTFPPTSNLNPTPGQPPTPNAVNVDLNAAGQFDVYNQFGNVHVIIDVVGYYDDHNHDDLYNAPNPTAVVSSTSDFNTGSTAYVPVTSTSITVPAGYNALLKADFSAESICTTASWCSVQIFVDGAPMTPNAGIGDFAFDDGGVNQFQSHQMIRTANVGPGAHTVEVRAANFGAGGNLRLDDYVLFVEAFLQ